MTTHDERQQVLEMLENGRISPDEAAQLLEALAEAQQELVSEVLYDEQSTFSEELPKHAETFEAEPLPAAPELPPEMRRWQNYWLGIFLAALGVLILFTFVMYQAFMRSGFGFWFICSWVPFLLSVAVVAWAWQSQHTPWLHLRIDQAENEWPRRIAFSFPLPLGLAGWIVRTFGHHIPNLDKAGLSMSDLQKLIYGLGDYTSPDNPIYIEVDEDDGEKVLIFIG